MRTIVPADTEEDAVGVTLRVGEGCLRTVTETELLDETVGLGDADGEPVLLALRTGLSDKVGDIDVDGVLLASIVSVRGERDSVRVILPLVDTPRVKLAVVDRSFDSVCAERLEVSEVVTLFDDDVDTVADEVSLTASVALTVRDETLGVVLPLLENWAPRSRVALPNVTVGRDSDALIEPVGVALGVRVGVAESVRLRIELDRSWLGVSDEEYERGADGDIDNDRHVFVASCETVDDLLDFTLDEGVRVLVRAFVSVSANVGDTDGVVELVAETVPEKDFVGNGLLALGVAVADGVPEYVARRLCSDVDADCDCVGSCDTLVVADHWCDGEASVPDCDSDVVGSSVVDMVLLFVMLTNTESVRSVALADVLMVVDALDDLDNVLAFVVELTPFFTIDADDDVVCDSLPLRTVALDWAVTLRDADVVALVDGPVRETL